MLAATARPACLRRRTALHSPVFCVLAEPVRTTVASPSRPAPVGDGQAARAVLLKQRRWQDVLAAEPTTGESLAGRVEALLRLARSLSIYTPGTRNQANTARARASLVLCDPRFAPLSSSVEALLPRLDAHRLDAVRSAFSQLGHRAGVAAADRARQARFNAQERVEALERVEVPVEALSLAVGAPPLLVLRSIAQAVSDRHQAAASVGDERFAALLEALEASADTMSDPQAAEALAILARLGAQPNASTLDALCRALTARLLRTHSTAMDPKDVLQALNALRVLRHRLRLRSAGAFGRVTARLLRTCPAHLVPGVLGDALAAGLPAAPLLASVGDISSVVKTVPPLEARALSTALLHAGGASSELFALLVARAGLPTNAPTHTSLTTPLRSIAARALRLSTTRVRRHRRSVVCASGEGNSSSTTVVGEELDVGATALAFFVPALGGLLFGFDIGVSSGALVSLQGAATSGTEWGPQLSPLLSGIVVSASLAGAVVASAAALAYGDTWGRRLELRAASSAYAAGAALMALSPSYGVLLLGRVVYGAGIGLAMHAAPMYIAETAPEKLRGTLVSAKEAAIVGGILIGFLTGAALISQEGGWRTMLGLSGSAALMMGVLSLRLAESPRWLAQTGRQREARIALAELRGTAVSQAAVDAEADRMLVPLIGQDGNTSLGPAALLSPRNAKALYVGVSLMLFQQITGQPSVLYYAVDIFRKTGFESAEAASQVTVLLGSFKLAMTLVAVATVDKLGRRPLLLGGVFLLTAALVALAVLASPSSPLDAQAGAYASAAALLLYVGAYQVSFGPISWLLVGEVFPAEVRSAAVGLATLVNFGSNTLVSLALPVLDSSVGQDGTYALFALVGVVSLVSIYLTVPETKGKTLEQIEAGWRKD